MIKTIAAAALALASAPALAQQPAAPATARVPIGDLDLTTADGRRTLDRRLQGAVRLVCPGDHAPDLQQRRHHRICLKAAKASIAEQRGLVLARAAAPVTVAAAAR